MTADAAAVDCGPLVEGRDFEVVGEAIQAQLAVSMDPAARCPVVEASQGGRVVSHQLKIEEGVDIERCQEQCSNPFSRGQCHTAVTPTEGGPQRREYLMSAITEYCVCPVLANHDCLRSVEGVRDGALIVDVTALDRHELRSIIDELRDRGAHVSVNWIRTCTTDHRSIEIDVCDITEKQRHTVKRALEMGYYDRPRKADLSDLAEELEVTESAISQRINSAEAKLVRTAFDSS